MSASIVCEIPYSEMKADSYDPSGWLSSMDIVADGDREVVYVICTDDVNNKTLTNHSVNMEVVEYDTLPQKPSQVSPQGASSPSKGSGSADMAIYPNGNVRIGNIVISKTEYAQANLDRIDTVMKVWGWKG